MRAEGTIGGTDGKGTVSGGSSASFTDNASDSAGFDQTKAYTYTVQPYYTSTAPTAIDADGTGASATADDFTGAIGNLRATVNSDNSATLRWSYQGQVRGFEIEDVDQGGPDTNYALISQNNYTLSSSPSSGYVVTLPAGDFNTGDTYGFRIRADNENGTVSDYAAISKSLVFVPGTLNVPVPSFTVENVSTGDRYWDADVVFDTANGLPDLPSGDLLSGKITRTGDNPLGIPDNGIIQESSGFGIDSQDGLLNFHLVGTANASYQVAFFVTDSNGDQGPPSALLSGGITLGGSGGSTTPPPITLSAAGNSNVVNWTWQEDSGEEYLEFYRVADDNGTMRATPVEVQSGDGIYGETATLLLPPGISNVFAVAVGDQGQSSYSNTVQLSVPPSGIPADPTPLAAVVDPNDDTKVDISWENTSGTQTAFVLKRSVNGGPTETIATLGPNTTSYVDSIPSETVEEVSAQYSITAVNSQGNSDPIFAVTEGIATAAKTAEPPDTAEFLGGYGSSQVDQYFGKLGDGWTDAWTPEAGGGATFKGTVPAVNPLKSGTSPSSKSYGNYLSAAVTSKTGNGTGVVSRNYTAAATGGISATAPQVISFLYRWDGGGNADDEATLFGTNGPAQEKEGSSDTWEAVAQLSGTGTWQFGGLATTGLSWNSMVTLVQSDVYRFTINLYPNGDSYTVSVANLYNPSQSATSPALVFRDATATGSSNIEAGMHLSSTAKEAVTANFSLDQVTVVPGSGPATAPVISSNGQPKNQNVVAGNTATFTVNLSGGAPIPSIEWQQSTGSGQPFKNLPTDTGGTLKFPSTASENGYEYRAKISNGVGSQYTVYSNPATLTVTSPSSGNDITVQPGDNLQKDLTNAAGGTLHFPAGTWTITTALLVPSGTIIEGAATSGTTTEGVPFSGTILNFDLNLDTLTTSSSDPHDSPYGFVIAAGATNVTIEGLDISSNLGLVKMADGGGYSSINIVDNELQYGGGNYIPAGSEVYGIWDSLKTDHFDVSYNYIHDSQIVPGSSTNPDRCCYALDSSDSNFDHNLIFNVANGFQLIGMGLFDSGSSNYATELNGKLFETTADNADPNLTNDLAMGTYDEVYDNNVTSDYYMVYQESEGVSIITQVPSISVKINDNYFRLEPTKDTSGNYLWGPKDPNINRSGFGIEVGGTGDTATVNNNTIGGPELPNGITSLSNATGTGNSVWGPLNFSGGAATGEDGGSWTGPVNYDNVFPDTGVNAMPAVPSNTADTTSAGPQYYPT